MTNTILWWLQHCLHFQVHVHMYMKNPGTRLSLSYTDLQLFSPFLHVASGAFCPLFPVILTAGSGFAFGLRGDDLLAGFDRHVKHIV